MQPEKLQSGGTSDLLRCHGVGVQDVGVILLREVSHEGLKLERGMNVNAISFWQIHSSKLHTLSFIKGKAGTFPACELPSCCRSDHQV